MLNWKCSAIFCDPDGQNTDATVRGTQPLYERWHRWHPRHVLAVRHAYHLPRVKMAYQRQGRGGYEVYTVPAHETAPSRQMPFLVCREVAALWAYHLRPLAR